MNTLVGWIVILIAAATVITVLVAVSREKIEHEEYFIPPAQPEQSGDGSAAE